MAQPTLKPLPKLEDYQAQAETMPPLNLGIRPILLVVLTGTLLSVFLISLAVGSVNIPLDQTIMILLGGEPERASWANIIFRVRLPKAITAMLAGAALSVSGLMMQTLFRNPLAASDVLGINSGASLGVALVVLSAGVGAGSLLSGVSFVSDLSLAAAAMLGAGLTLALILFIARHVENSLTLLILGLMIGSLTFALVSLLLYFSIPERIQAYVNWGFGSFGSVTWGQLPILSAAVLAGLLLSWALGKTLNTLLLGETYAASLGLNVRLARLLIIAATALLTGTVTAFCGPITFIGIAVPHLCRSILSTSDHRLLVPGTILVGAVAALAASLIAELPGSTNILPLNAVMALFGAPIVIWIILRQRNLQRAFIS
jgi:iron complex transport system permease protein